MALRADYCSDRVAVLRALAASPSDESQVRQHVFCDDDWETS
jgi:hypothetical protein